MFAGESPRGTPHTPALIREAPVRRACLLRGTPQGTLREGRAEPLRGDQHLSWWNSVQMATRLDSLVRRQIH